MIMRILLVFILLSFFTQAFASSSKAIIIDSRALIKYSTLRYKDLNYTRDRDSGRYYYANKEELILYNTLTNLKDVDIYIADSFVGRRINSTLSRLGYDLDKIKEVIKVRRNKIDLELFQNYSQTLVVEYTTLFNSSFTRYDIGVNYKFYKSPKDATTAFKKLSRKDRRKYSQLYPTSQNNFSEQKRQNQNIIKTIFNFTQDLNLQLSLPVDTSLLTSLIINGYKIKWDTQKTKILSENLETITSCSIQDLHNSNKYIIDESYCQKLSLTKGYTLVSDNGYWTDKSCYSTIDNFISKPVQNHNCAGNSTKYKWAFSNGQVQTCNRVTVDKELIIDENRDLSYCLNSLGSSFTWTYHFKNKSVLGCMQTTTVPHQLQKIKDYTIEECLDLPEMKSLATVAPKLDDKNLINGCMLSTSDTNTFIKDLPQSLCEQSINIKYEWIKNTDNTKVVGCRKFDSVTNLDFPHASIEDCKKALKTDFHWKHKNRKVISCKEVTHSAPYALIKIMPTTLKCENNSGVKHKFEISNGKVTHCTKRSNWRNLLISTTTELTPCIQNLPKLLVTTTTYDNNKKNVLACSSKLKTGDLLPPQYTKACDFKASFLKSDTNDFIKGCYQINPIDGRGIRKAPISKCISNDKIAQVDYLYSSSDSLVEGCYATDPQSGLPILDLKVSLDRCREKQPSTYAWKGLEQNSCLEFTHNKLNHTYYKIGPAQSKDCDENLHALYDRDIFSYHIVEGSQIDPSLSYKEVITATEPDMHKLAKENIEIFRHYLIKTNRKITTYNYRKRNLVSGNTLKLNRRGKANIHSKIAIDYSNEWMDAIWNFNPDEKGMLGWGLYTASNPLHSKSYGGANWAMIAIDLPKHSNILDIRSIDRGYIPLTKKAWSLFVNKCGVPVNYFKNKDNSQIHMAVHKVNYTSCELAHQAFTKALKTLKINAIAYTWISNRLHINSERPNVCDTKASHATFVIVQTPLNSSTVRLFVPEGTQSPTTNELKWHSYINHLAQDYQGSTILTSTHDNSQFPNDSRAYEKWKSDSQFACKDEHTDTDKVAR